MQYIEFTVSVPADRAEVAAEALRAATDAGIAIDAPFSQPDLESDAVALDDAPAHVRAYVPATTDAPALRRAVGDALAVVGVVAELRVRAVDEEDWAEAWKEHFHVERFGRVVVVPSWRTYDAAPGDVVLTLDPGMAFGTGQHETTRMCLEALAVHLISGARVLDTGCGSGILAIAAAKLGAASVLAVDVDADCVRISAENARANAVDDRVQSRVIFAGDASWADAGAFDIVVANIIAATILDLAPTFRRVLAGGGRLIASGIIGAREDEVRDGLTGLGFDIASVRAMGEWRCIEAVTPGRPA